MACKGTKDKCAIVVELAVGEPGSLGPEPPMEVSSATARDRMALGVCVPAEEEGLACRLDTGVGKRSSPCRQRRSVVVSPVPAWGLLCGKSTPSSRK